VNDPTDTSKSEPRRDAESDRLSVEKLRLEVRALSKPWWASPSNWAPVATISGALFAFAWAATSGFFDVSRRELDVRRRELQYELQLLEHRRDAQSVEIQHLRRRIADLDRPVLTDVTVDSSQSDYLTLQLSGLNLGKLPGNAYLVLRHTHLDCTVIIPSVDKADAAGNAAAPPKPMECRPVIVSESVTAEIAAWTPHRVTLKISSTAAQSSLDRLRRMPEFEPSMRNFELLTNIERTDKVKSNPLSLINAAKWLTTRN
jgi:hypothetical protein